MPEVKDLKEQLGGVIEEFKHARDRFNEEKDKMGEARQETKDMLDRLNNDMDELKNRMDEVETANNRPGVGGDEGKGDEQDQERKAAFYKFIRQGQSGLANEERKALQPKSAEQKALVENSTGEILVPEDLDQEIYRELPKLTIMRQLATVRNTNSDRVRKRSVTEVTVGWGKLATDDTKTLEDYESTMVPSEEYDYVENVYGLTKVGEDELQDSDVNLQQLFADSFRRAFAEAEDTAFIVGTGHANHQPEGILNSSVGKFNGKRDSQGKITADDFIKLKYEVPAQYRKNGSFIVNSSTELALRLLKDADGQYLWQPSLQVGTPNSFDGNSIYTEDDMPEISTSAADIAIFGDIRAGYRILNRTGGSIKRLDEKYIEDDLIGFRFKRRVGDGVVRPDAMRILHLPKKSTT